MERNQNNNQQLEQATPLDGASRLHHIDSIRGFALFGILIVNMLAFQYGRIGYQFALPDFPWYDQIIYIIIEWLFLGSFYPIFSILFGFGAVMMWENADSKGNSANKLFLRRFLLLLIIGLVHLYFIWDGDILVTYAVAGLFLLFFLKRQPKTMLVWVVILAVVVNVVSVSGETGEAIDFSHYLELERDVYAHGTYREVVALRLTVNPIEKLDFGLDAGSVGHQMLVSVITVTNHVILVCQALMLFLLGAMIAKKRWLHRIKEHRHFLRNMAVLFGVLGVALKGGMVVTQHPLLEGYGYILGGPFLAIAYIAIFALLFDCYGPTRWFRGFSYVGRLALTNYLLQSIVMTTIFYGYGFGLFGKVGLLVGMVLATGYFVVSVVLSRWWLTRFTLGPAEWVWRAGTYFRLPRLKKVR